MFLLHRDLQVEEFEGVAPAAGATGITVIHQARGEGRAPAKWFLGMEIRLMCDALMFVVTVGCAERVLAAIAEAGGFEEEGAGQHSSLMSRQPGDPSRR